MKRDVTFDIMKGLGILLVIIGHTNDIPYIVNNFIFSFHMPLFFLLSGYFYSPQKNNILIKKMQKRLLVPYIFTGFIIILLNIIIATNSKNYDLIWRSIIAVFYGTGSKHTSLYWGDMPYIGPIWFLLALFWAKLVWNFIIRTNANLKINLTIALIVSFFSTLIDRYYINLPFGFLPGMSAIIFIAIGHEIKNYEPPFWMIVILLGCWGVCIFHSQLYMVRCWYGHYFLDIFGAIGGTLFVFYLSRLLNKKFIASTLSWFGINSMAILCFHTIDLQSGFIDAFPWYVTIPLRISLYSIVTWGLFKVNVIRKIYGINQCSIYIKDA